MAAYARLIATKRTYLGEGAICAQASVKSGDPVEVSWRNAPGNKFDWIGIYSATDPDLYN